MKHISTPNLLLLNLYRELPAMENLELIERLNEDDSLNTLSQTLEKGLKLLPKATFSPKNSTLRSILAYSERSSLAQC